MSDSLAHDLRTALRLLNRSRGFAAAAVVMLALGIGANTALFSVLRATSLRGSTLPDPDRLAIIYTLPAGDPDGREGARIVEYFAWRDRNRTFTEVGSMLQWQSTVGAVRDGEPAERLSGWRFSASAFRAVGIAPQLGRFFTPEEDVPTATGAADIVVISDRLWRTRFDADPGVIGRTMLLDGSATTIVGVMPPGFGVLDTQSDIWLPSPFSFFQIQSRSTNRVLTIVGRLRPDTSVEQAQSDMESIAAALAAEDPAPQQGRGILVEPLDGALFGVVREVLGVLQGAVGFVLLIACANVAGLLLVRAAARQQDVAIRHALGASRTRIVRVFLIESLLLSAAGGLAGVALAWWSVQLLVDASPAWLNTVTRIGIDGSVLAFTSAISLVTAVAFGTAPALGVSASDLVTPLKAAARAASGARGHRRMQSAMVVAQVTLTLVLLVGAGLLIRSFWRLQQVPLGLEPGGVLTFQTRLPANKYFSQVGVQNGFAQLNISPVPGELFDRVRERLQQVPGVVSVAGTNVPPVAGGAMAAPFTIEGRPIEGVPSGAGPNAAFATGDGGIFANYTLVTPDYFSALRIPVRGREFTPRDRAGTPPVAVINEAMAGRYWPGENPIGRRITVGIVAGQEPREIVGVVGDTPVSRLDRAPEPALYVPHLQESLRSRVPYGQSRVTMTFMLRIDQPLSAVVPAVRRAIGEVDASLPVSQVEMMDAYLSRQIAAPRDSMLLVAAFGAVALVLAAFGIYGIVAYGVVQRTHEIGIRMALGARRLTVLGLVLRQSTALTAVGLVLGLAAAAALSRYMQNLLFDLTPLDAATFMAVPAVFVLIAALAAYLPARRATKLDPQIVLRRS
jgi:putative ABC transport system permease protein